MNSLLALYAQLINMASHFCQQIVFVVVVFRGAGGEVISQNTLSHTHTHRYTHTHTHTHTHNHTHTHTHTHTHAHTHTHTHTHTHNHTHTQSHTHTHTHTHTRTRWHLCVCDVPLRICEETLSATHCHHIGEDRHCPPHIVTILVKTDIVRHTLSQYW